MELNERELSVLCWAMNSTQEDVLFMYDPHPKSMLSRESDEYWEEMAATINRTFQRLGTVPVAAKLEALTKLLAMEQAEWDHKRTCVAYTREEVEALAAKLRS